MKLFLLSCLIFQFLLLQGGKTIAVPTASSSGSPSTANKEYKPKVCSIIEECSPCSFSQLKYNRECMVYGNIIIKKCVQVNVNDPKDEKVDEEYEACQLTGFPKYGMYLYILLLFGSLAVFLFLLFNYRKQLQINMYKRLSLKSPL